MSTKRGLMLIKQPCAQNMNRPLKKQAVEISVQKYMEPVWNEKMK